MRRKSFMRKLKKFAARYHFRHASLVILVLVFAIVGAFASHIGLAQADDSVSETWVSNKTVVVGVAGSSSLAATQVSIGSTHTCGVLSGKAYCWGQNNYGQLGNNSTTDSKVPVAVNASGVLSGKSVTEVSARYLDNCVVANGAAYCWGNNGQGQLGNGTTTSSLVPVAVNTSGVLSGKTVTDITGGYNTSCAIANGAAYCWGLGASGQLGNSLTSNSSVPVAVNTAGALSGKTVTSISSDNSVSCAIANGAAYCWGWNAYGQLGNNSTTNSSVPVAVNTSGVLSGKTVTAISVFGDSVCAVASGQAYCWGWNNYGQLGNNSTTTSLVPVAVNTSGVLSGKTVTDIGGGDTNVCAVANGAVYCWGNNTHGRLGNNSTTTSLVPVAVNTSGVLSGKPILNAVANSNSCALALSNIYCWGQNDYGQLGNNSTTDSYVPIKVSLPSS